MSALYEHGDYQTTLNSFNLSNCKWSHFEEIHKDVSNNRCPICEYSFSENKVRLAKSGNETMLFPTIDHYRPQKYYSFLKCEHKNYLLMCSECNNIYKGSKFPLYNSPEHATDISKIADENPLLVNPIHDNLLELFMLVFRQSDSGKRILELRPKETTGYLYEKAQETIKLFGLGNCEFNRHSNDNVYNCRIQILETHFGVFYEFVKALSEGSREKASLELRANKELFESYGFFEFIKKQQFIIQMV